MNNNAESNTNVKKLFFNEEIKEEFFNTIKETSQQSYRRIFIITNKFEKALNKDLNQFTLEEVETILYSFNATIRNTVESYARIISSYLNWSVLNGFTSKNVLSSLTPESFEKYVADESEYLSEANLRKIEDRCANYQDAVILRLIFAGAGSKELSEIRNLKKDDVNFETKQIKLTNTLQVDSNGKPIKFTERILDVDERTLHLIKGAIEQETYLKSNGEVAPTLHNNIRPYTDLVDNDYVVRASITRNDNWNSPVDKYVIYRRMKVMSELLLSEKSLTAKYIQRSGILYSVHDSIGYKEVTLDDLKIVADKFNIRSYHNLKGFVTAEKIEEIYPKNI